MYTKAIYPGTFDPVTNGHVDIIKRACKIFDKIIVAVADNKDKNTMFNLEKRVEMMKKATAGFEKVEVKSFDSLLVKFAQKENSKNSGRTPRCGTRTQPRVLH